MNPTAAAIQDAVARVNNLTRDQMLSKTRRKEIVKPRQAAMYLVRHLRPEMPLMTIARAFGKLDHTTVLCAVAATLRRLRDEPELQGQLDRASLIAAGMAS